MNAVTPPRAVGFAPGLSAALAAPSAAAAETFPPAGPGPSPDIQKLAALCFADEGAALEAAVGTVEEWEGRSYLDGWRVRVAASFLRRNHHEVRDSMRTMGFEAITDLMDSTLSLANRFRGLADILDAAHVRMMAGLAGLVMKGDVKAEAVAAAQLAPDGSDPASDLPCSLPEYVFQMSPEEILYIALRCNGKRDCLDLSPEAFSDALRGWARAQLDVMGNNLANKLQASRGEP